MLHSGLGSVLFLASGVLALVSYLDDNNVYDSEVLKAGIAMGVSRQLGRVRTKMQSYLQ